MTAARLRLVEEAKGDTAGKRRRDAAQGEVSVTPKAQAARADGEKASPPMPASRTRVRPRKRASCVGDVMRSVTIGERASD